MRIARAAVFSTSHNKSAPTLHGFPCSTKGISQGGILHPIDELNKVQGVRLTELNYLREIVLRIDLDFFVRCFAFNANGATADGEDTVGADQVVALESLKQHGVWVGKVCLVSIKCLLRPLP